MYSNHFLEKHLAAVVHQFEQKKDKADKMMKLYLKKHRIGKRDRKWIRDHFYYYIRHKKFVKYVADNEDIPTLTSLLPKLFQDKQCEQKYINQLQNEYKNNLYFSFPNWMLKKLDDRFSGELSDIAAWLNTSAETTIRVNTQKIDRQKFIDKLKDAGFKNEKTPLSPDGIIILENESKLQQSELFKHGFFDFMDESSQLVTYLINKDTKALLDGCAGGGGKSIAIASKYPNSKITATDVRTFLFKEVSRRARKSAVSVKTLQKDEIKGVFDTVLIDAPCSGSGVLRRNPEDRYRITKKKIHNLNQKQLAILNQYADYVASGGELIYVTCSFFIEENEDVIEKFLIQNPSFTLEPVEPRMIDSDISTGDICRGSYYLTTPGFKRDLFFGAVLKKYE